MAWADPLLVMGLRPAGSGCLPRLSTLRIRDHASRDRHPAQHSPSAAANHATRASVSQPTLHVNTSSPITGFPSTYLRLPRVDLRSSTGVNLRFAFHSEEFAVTAKTLTRAGAQDAHVVVSRISAEEMNKSDDSRATVRGELLLHTA